MNVRRRAAHQPASAWAVEVQRFRSLMRKWLDHWLNKFFDLTIRGPATRRYWVYALGAGFLAAGFVLHIILYYIPPFARVRPFVLSEVPLFAVLTLARLAIILLIPASIAVTLAGNYLTDVFELKDPSIAWDYIETLALGESRYLSILQGGRVSQGSFDATVPGGSKYIVRIRDGQVAPESANSPVLLIGGPGAVIVEFDSAALFEKPDGTPHVIGLASTTPDSGPDPNIILDGFERLREPILNLRDQYIGNPSGEPMTIVSRSLDGIPVSAIDVRGMFSVRRQKVLDVAVSKIQAPYPFDPADIETLIYEQDVQVLTEGPYASGQPPKWSDTMRQLIRESLVQFMSEHYLGEYLAGIGPRESELSEFREDTIVSATLRYSKEMPDSNSQVPPPRKVQPRTALIDVFTKPGESFAQKAHERGLELHWAGLGTWKMPNELSWDRIREQHLEAWQLNRQNADRSSQRALDTVAEEACLDEKLKLIQRVPIASHEKNQAKYQDKDTLVKCLLQNYWDQIGDGLDVYYESGKPQTEIEAVEKAVLRIERLLRITAGHMIGGGRMSRVRSGPERNSPQDAPPAPGSRQEEEDYRALLTKLGGDYRVVEGLIAKEGRRHPEMARADLIHRIVLRFERYYGR